LRSVELVYVHVGLLKRKTVDAVYYSAVLIKRECVGRSMH
jgi:hypothetical protein